MPSIKISGVENRGNQDHDQRGVRLYVSTMTYTQVKYNVVPMINMSQAQTETFRVGAVNSVLGSLGEELFSILRDHLQRYYKITLGDDALFTLEELQIALQRMLGDESARLMISEIHYRINDLSKMQLRKTAYHLSSFSARRAMSTFSASNSEV